MTDSNAVKFVDGSDDLIEGLILPYDGPVNGNDLTGTHFTKSTDYCAAWFPDGGRPGLYAHGFDTDLGLSVIGREVKSWKGDKGVWLQAQLDKAHEYWAEIKQLVDAGKLSLSSGAVDHLVQVAAKSGEINVWPWVEWSLVANPANPDAVVYSVKSADAAEHMAVLGVKAPEEMTDAPPEEPVAATTDEPPVDAPSVRTAGGPATEGADYIVGETGPETLVLGPGGLIHTKEGRRNSTSDQNHLQAIHDASAALGAACGPSADEPAGKALDTPPTPVLAVKAGDNVVPVSDADLDKLRDAMKALAVSEARRILRL